MPHMPDSTHETHELELVAAYASGDAAGADLERASALVATCADCATLHRDLRLIAAAMPGLPAPARPRDFRLTQEDAARLRPAGIRGLLSTLAGPRFSFAAPLGSGLAALGIVGVLVASGGAFPSGSGGAATRVAEPQPVLEAPAMEAAPGAPSPAAAAGAAQARESLDPITLKAEPTAEPEVGADNATGTGPADAGDAGTSASQFEASDVPVAEAQGIQPLAALGIVLVFVGFVLLGARFVARRLARAP